MKNTEIHIGKLIKAEMQKQGRRAVWLAEQLGCHRNNVYLIYSRSWIDTEMLMKIATALRHDFFGDLSKEWQKGD